jgi:hypothetical protein
VSVHWGLDAGEGEALRAHALRALVPPFVHRLNNALAVVRLVHELVVEASPEELAKAREAMLVLRDGLERLALYANGEPQPVGRGGWIFDGLRLLVAPLAEQRRATLVLRPGAVPPELDARLAGAVHDLFVVLLGEARGPSAVGVRLSAAVVQRAHRSRLALAALGFSAGPRLELALQALVARARAEACTLRVRRRSGSRAALALRLELPPGAPPVAGPATPARAAACRVLLLHAPGAVREELALLLGENGFAVCEASDVLPRGAFELVLVAAELARLRPELLQRLSALPERPRIELLPVGLGAQELLRLARGP